jgi:hypothetical protein
MVVLPRCGDRSVAAIRHICSTPRTASRVLFVAIVRLRVRFRATRFEHNESALLQSADIETGYADLRRALKPTLTRSGTKFRRQLSRPASTAGRVQPSKPETAP